MKMLRCPIARAYHEKFLGHLRIKYMNICMFYEGGQLAMFVAIFV